MKRKFSLPALRSIWLPASILMCGFFVAVFMEYKQRQSDHTHVQGKLSSRLEQITGAVSERLIKYEYGTAGLRGAILAKGFDAFNYSSMRAYSDSRQIEREFPGARGFGLIRYVSVDQEQAFVQRARQERPDGSFDIRQLQAHEQSRFIIQYVEPELRNEQAVGLDIGSESMRRAAALQAVANNQVTLTAPITLVQASQKSRHGFLILQAIYQGLPETQSSAERLSNLKGWSYAPLLIDEVLEGVSSVKDDVNLTISDVSQGNSTTFYQHGQVATDDTEYWVSRGLSIYGREWVLALNAKQAFVTNMQLPSKYSAFARALAIALLISLLVFTFQLVGRRRQQEEQHEAELAKVTENALVAANQRLEQEVAERTREITQVSILQKSVVDGAAYAIIASDDVGIITVFNPAAEKLLGYSADDIIGKETPAIFHVADEVVARAEALSIELGYTVEPGFESFVAKVRRGEEDDSTWIYVDKSGQHIPVRLNLSSLQDEGQKLVGFLGIAYDLTEQLEHERVLAEAREQAEQASAAKSSFLANMSHEIRTPLNGIYGTLQLLGEKTSSEHSKNLIDKALYSTRALNTIINDILDFSKIEAGKLALEKASFSLSELLVYLESDLSHMAINNDVDFVVCNKVEYDAWEGDSVRIRQILLNITANALKFTQQGQVKVEASLSIEQEGLLFSIQDTGIGIDKSQLQRLFKRFEQADTSTTRKFGGTGLGLSITHSLVTMMSGHISVQSELGIGTTFLVFLPLNKANQATETQNITQVNTDLSNRLILIAEDNEINQAIVEAMLAPTKATIIFADNGIEAIHKAKTTHPDLILMDIQMPEMDGTEACKQIKLFAPGLPIIALTANVMSDNITEYEQAGFDGYLSKPVELNLLLTTISQQLNNEL